VSLIPRKVYLSIPAAERPPLVFKCLS